MEDSKRDVQMAVWKRRIQERQDSGMTIDQWCHKNKLSKNSYYYWLKVIRKEELKQCEKNTPAVENNQIREFVGPLSIVPAATETPAQTDVVSVPAAVLRKGDFCIELYADTPQPLIETLIGELIHV